MTAAELATKGDLEAVVDELRAVRAELAAMRRALPAQLLTLAQAAERLNVSVPAVRRMVKAGRLKARKVGRDWRIDPADLAGATEAEIVDLAHRARFR